MSDDVREHFESARVPGLALDPQTVLIAARRRRRTRRMIQGGASTAGLAAAAVVVAAVGLRAAPTSQDLPPASTTSLTSTTDPTGPPPTTATAVPTAYPTVPTVTASGPTSSPAPSVTRRPSARPSTTEPAAPAPTPARVTGQLGEKAVFSMGFNSHGDRVWAENGTEGKRTVRFEQATDANQGTWLPNVQMTVPSSGVGDLHYGTLPPSGVAYLVTPYQPEAVTLTSRSGARRSVEYLSTVQIPGTSWFALIIPAQDHTKPFSTQVSKLSWTDHVGNVYTVAVPAA